VDVRASRSGGTYRTSVFARVRLGRLLIGHTLPRGSSVESVRLNGRARAYRTRLTNRGLEVRVRAPRLGVHQLVVKAR
jgi:hypothetical protein